MSSITETVEVPRYRGLDQWTLARWIKDHSALTGTAHAVALHLALWYYREDSGRAFPSVERLARDVRTSPRSVYRAIEAMIETGEWVIIQGSGGRRNTERSHDDDRRTNVYYPVITGSMPTGVTSVASMTITVRERVPRQPMVPVEALVEPDDTYADESAVDPDERDYTAVEPPVEEGTTESDTAVPDAEATGDVAVVEAWVARALPDHLARFQRMTAAQRRQVREHASDLRSWGYDPADVLDNALAATRANGQDVHSAAGWVVTAMARPEWWRKKVASDGESGMNAGMAPAAGFADFLNNGLASMDPDMYGETGQEF